MGMTHYKDAAPTALAKNGLVAGAGRSTVEPAMKILPGKENLSGFTLLELLVLICLIAIVSALMLPTGGGSHKARIINCAHNLKSIDEDFLAWSQRHDGKLPMQVASQNGGTLDLIQSESALVHFFALRARLKMHES